MNIRDRRWDAKEPAEALWARLNEAWREIRTYAIVSGDVAEGGLSEANQGAVTHVSVSRAAVQSIPNATDTRILFDTVESKSGAVTSMIGNANAAVEVGTTGLYRVTTNMGITATVDAAANQVNTVVFKNGFLTGVRILDSRVRSASGWTYYTATRDVVLNAGDVLTLGVYQVNGGALNTATDAAARPRLQVTWIGSV